MNKVIGIDLGTTNSCVSVLEGDAPVIITNTEGYRTTPSVVSFHKDGSADVGNAAKRQATLHPERTSISIKRKMGSDYRMKAGSHTYSPQEISAYILRKLKKDAEEYLGYAVTDAVITVPAYFNDLQRQATKDAGRIAGLNVLRIINEPTAAALAYGLDNGEPQKILVYDLGGGTFDVSLIEIGDGLIEVIATSGDNLLGGDDFDSRIADRIAEEIKAKTGASIKKDEAVMYRIKEEAERVKKELSSSMSALVNLPFIVKGKDGPVSFEMTFTREEFERLTADLIERTRMPVENALSDAGVTKSEISKILLVGGSTRMPAVQEMITGLMGMEPSRNLNPDECVALGAAIQGGKLSGQIAPGSAADNIVLMDVTPLSLSIETIGGVANRLIERNTTIPVRQSKIFTTASNFQSSVDVRVFQGERKFTRDNKLLGNFKLGGIKRALAGIPQIEVTFDIDANGIVNVSACDLHTGNRQSITITSSSNLSEDEIQRAIWKAQVYEEEDGELYSLADEKRKAEQIVKKAQRQLAMHKDDWDKIHRKEVKDNIQKMKRLLLRLKFTRNEEAAVKVRNTERSLKALLE